MASMAKIMRKKAVRACSARRSSVVVKRVSKSDIAILNSRMEPIIRANEKERLAGENAVAGSMFGSRF